MGQIINIILQLACGGLGGMGAGKIMPKQSLGTIGNIISGIVGGVGGSTLLSSVLGIGANAVANGTGGLDIGSILNSVLGSGVGGGVLMVVVSLLKNLLSKKN